jgi:hypothetical protein
MRVNILRKGDKIISVTQNLIAVSRKGGEVDLIPLINDDTGWRVDCDKIVTIGYGSNTVEVELEDGSVITNF